MVRALLLVIGLYVSLLVALLGGGGGKGGVFVLARGLCLLLLLLHLMPQHPPTHPVTHSVAASPLVQVYLASASPPVRYPNVYGVDMPTRT